MKAIIYYTLSNQTKEYVEDNFEGDFYRLEGTIKIPKRYWLQLFYLGYYASTNQKLKYKPFDIDFDKYDEIVLASPTWAFTIVPFMKKFLINNKFKNKKVTLVLTHAGGPKNAMKHFKKYLDPSNEIVEEKDIQCGLGYQQSNYLKK